MMRSLLRAVAMVTTMLLTAGCVSSAELVRALGEDPASVCISVTTIYGKGGRRAGSAARSR